MAASRSRRHTAKWLQEKWNQSAAGSDAWKVNNGITLTGINNCIPYCSKVVGTYGTHTWKVQVDGVIEGMRIGMVRVGGLCSKPVPSFDNVNCIGVELKIGTVEFCGTCTGAIENLHVEPTQEISLVLDCAASTLHMMFPPSTALRLVTDCLPFEPLSLFVSHRNSKSRSTIISYLFQDKPPSPAAKRSKELPFISRPKQPRTCIPTKNAAQNSKSTPITPPGRTRHYSTTLKHENNDAEHQSNNAEHKNNNAINTNMSPMHHQVMSVPKAEVGGVATRLSVTKAGKLPVTSETVSVQTPKRALQFTMPTTPENTRVNKRVGTNVDTNARTNVDTNVDIRVDKNADTNIDTNLDTNLDTSADTNVYTPADADVDTPGTPVDADVVVTTSPPVFLRSSTSPKIPPRLRNTRASASKVNPSNTTTTNNNNTTTNTNNNDTNNNTNNNNSNNNDNNNTTTTTTTTTATTNNNNMNSTTNNNNNSTTNTNTNNFTTNTNTTSITPPPPPTTTTLSTTSTTQIASQPQKRRRICVPRNFVRGNTNTCTINTRMTPRPLPARGSSSSSSSSVVLTMFSPYRLPPSSNKVSDATHADESGVCARAHILNNRMDHPRMLPTQLVSHNDDSDGDGDGGVPTFLFQHPCTQHYNDNTRDDGDDAVVNQQQLLREFLSHPPPHGPGLSTELASRVLASCLRVGVDSVAQLRRVCHNCDDICEVITDSDTYDDDDTVALTRVRHTINNYFLTQGATAKHVATIAVLSKLMYPDSLMPWGLFPH